MRLRQLLFIWQMLDKLAESLRRPRISRMPEVERFEPVCRAMEGGQGAIHNCR